MTTDRMDSTAPAPLRRRDAPADPRALPAAFDRYVDAVLSLAEPTPSTDVEAALTLAHELRGHRRGAAVDASLAEVYGPSMRELAMAVRRAGRGAVVHPGLLARAVVLARTLERTGAGRRAAERQRALAATAAR
jgi:hypothetical protein